MSTAPLLSIGMIFKNEARCLERCLQSLQPLREAIPCELVMADTGADDGSREIAEKYADQVFDFPWINDFAAARNAVMDRCCGKWYLTIDSDEWLDADISELLAFLQSRKRVDFAFVIQRNYFSPELDKGEIFNNFCALHLIRMSIGERYHGAIHESWHYYAPIEKLAHTILHHDGYFYDNPKSLKKKQQRNMALLREQLKQKPDSLHILMQCIESGGTDTDLVQYIRRAIVLIRARQKDWQWLGGAIMRHAVEIAYKQEMPEREEWLDYAIRQFSASIYIKIDVNYTAFWAVYEDKDWKSAIQYGEGYREGVCALHTEPHTPLLEEELLHSTIHSGNAVAERTLLIALANVYLQAGYDKKAQEILTGLSGKHLSSEQVRNATVILSQLHAETILDVMPALRDFYDQIGCDESGVQKQQARLAAFDAIAAAAFTKSYREEEQQKDNYHRPAFTAFACLADRCEAGRGAKIMMTDDVAEMRDWLARVEDWQALPIEALEHALDAGVPFPLPDKPLPAEVLDGLAARLTHDENRARQLTLALPDEQAFPDWQSRAWTLALALAALKSFDWTLGKNQAPVSKFYCPDKKKDQKPDRRPPDTPETGLALVRRFAALQTAALPLLYAPALLCEENAALLPPMHRWGFYCAGALRELDAGRPQAYLAALRRGLTACPGEKEMVQFLLDRFMEDARPAADPELLALADRVRAILDAYSPDDPAVAAIRQSPAYRQVAWLIETPSTGDDANDGPSAPDRDIITAALPQ